MAVSRTLAMRAVSGLLIASSTAIGCSNRGLQPSNRIPMPLPSPCYTVHVALPDRNWGGSFILDSTGTSYGPFDQPLTPTRPHLPLRFVDLLGQKANGWWNPTQSGEVALTVWYLDSGFEIFFPALRRDSVVGWARETGMGVTRARLKAVATKTANCSLPPHTPRQKRRSLAGA
jgi:hypothetical protein